MIKVVHVEIFYDLNDFLTQELMQTTVYLIYAYKMSMSPPWYYFCNVLGNMHVILC